MRDTTHRAAALIALGLLTDDLYGTLLEARSTPRPTPERTGFRDRDAAARWLAEERDAEAGTSTLRRTYTIN